MAALASDFAWQPRSCDRRCERRRRSPSRRSLVGSKYRLRMPDRIELRELGGRVCIGPAQPRADRTDHQRACGLAAGDELVAPVALAERCALIARAVEQGELVAAVRVDSHAEHQAVLGIELPRLVLEM